MPSIPGLAIYDLEGNEAGGVQLACFWNSDGRRYHACDWAIEPTDNTDTELFTFSDATCTLEIYFRKNQPTALPIGGYYDVALESFTAELRVINEGSAQRRVSRITYPRKGEPCRPDCLRPEYRPLCNTQVAPFVNLARGSTATLKRAPLR